MRPNPYSQRFAIPLLLILILAACKTAPQPEPPLLPEPWNQDLATWDHHFVYDSRYVTKSLSAGLADPEAVRAIRARNWDPDSLLQALPGFRNLEALNLSLLPLSNSPAWFEALAKLPKLKKLNLDRCALSELPPAIGKLQSLEVLSLNGNALEKLPPEFFQLKKLRLLELERNPDLSDIEGNWSGFPDLQVLWLNLVALETLPESLGNCPKLVNLSLSRAGLKTLPTSIGNLQALQRLDLNFNQLDSLPSSLGKLGSLEELYLNGNPLTHLPESLGQLPQLQTLFLAHTNLSEIPTWIGKLTTLRSLSIAHTSIRKLPGEMRNLVNLRFFKTEGSQVPQEAISGLERELGKDFPN